MKKIFSTLLFVLSVVLAQGYNGIFKNDAGTGQIVLQQFPDSTLQGIFSGMNGQMQMQGYWDAVKGITGSLFSQEGQLSFYGQLSPDGLTLELEVAPYGPDGQPEKTAAQQLTYHRVSVVASNPLSTPTPTSTNPQLPIQPVTTDPFVGTFSDSEFTLQLQGANGQYQGILFVDSQQISITAQGNQTGLTGSINDQGEAYPFTLSAMPNGLIFAIDGEQIPLQRQTAEANNPMSANPMPNPLHPNPLNPNSLNPNPAPQPVPASMGGMPQPPRKPWQGTYQIAVYSQTNPAQKQTGVLTLQVTPMQDGNFRVVSTVNGQTLVDITVTAAGMNTVTGQEEFPLAWNTGKSSVYGVPGQLSGQNGMTLFMVQSGQDAAQAMYDPSGILVSYKGCLSGECTEMNLGQ